MIEEAELLEFEEDLEFEESPPVSAFRMRHYQSEALTAIDDGFESFGRLLAVLATGCGKTVIFSQVARDEVAGGGRVLILAHSEELLAQAADKLERSTGLISEREKADDRASLSASVVIASVQTLSRDHRLTGFPDDHFTLVIIDEAHRSLAKSYRKILNYFHFGSVSLEPEWKMPEPGIPYERKAKLLGVTATADRGDKRDLGEMYQKIAYDYGLLQACRDGYLVRPISVQVPLKIDMRGVKVSRTSSGSDFDVNELTAKITPFLKGIAAAIREHAGTRKTVCFLPGIVTAKLLAEALAIEGLNASFVSGACPDRSEKLAAFDAAGNGSVICNAMLLTEGWDCPDVSAVCVLRPTKIRSLYTQMVGRGTRTLPGCIDGLDTREDRLRAIASSAKPDLMILDFLWLTDRLDLVQPMDLVAVSPQMRDAMSKKGGVAGGDLLQMVDAAEKDLFKSLEAAAKAHSRKQARVVDPLAWAVSLGDEKLASYQPDSEKDALPPTPPQIALLERNGIDATKIQYRGLASKVIDRVIHRQQLKLCTVKQMNFLERLGVRDAALMSMDEASRVIDATIKKKRTEQTN